MLPIADSLKAKLQEVNRALAAKYKAEANPNREELRRLITAAVGRIRPLVKLAPAALQAWTGGRSIVAVDGSVNQIGGVYPHYLALIQALAKGTGPGETILLSDLHTPLLPEVPTAAEPERSPQAEDARARTRKMAGLEMQAAMAAIRAFAPKLVMLDGSLVHFHIENAALWQDLADLALARGVLLVGVTEEIGTQTVAAALKHQLPVAMREFYDRELLFGLLDYGEILEIQPDRRRKQAGLRTSFMRSAQDPHPVGVDMLLEQVEQMPAVADFLYTLTPESGRGFPIWLDIVDSEVRLTDAMVEGLTEAYLEPDLRQKLFSPKRQERMY